MLSDCYHIVPQVGLGGCVSVLQTTNAACGSFGPNWCPSAHLLSQASHLQLSDKIHPGKGAFAVPDLNVFIHPRVHECSDCFESPQFNWAVNRDTPAAKLNGLQESVEEFEV